LGVCEEKKKERTFTVAVKFYENSCHVIIKCVKDNMKSKTDFFLQLLLLLWKLKNIVMQFHVVFRNF